MKKIIPIFFACDERFVKYMVVTLTSIMKNASLDYNYNIHVLHTGISKDMQNRALKLENDNFKIYFNDCLKHLDAISDKLPTRDYYSKTTYYRIFIADMFKEYDKVIYIDSDTIVLGDISELYNIDIKDNFVGACNDQPVANVDIFGKYAENVLGINRFKYFNAGMLLINTYEFRKYNVLNQFLELLGEYNFVVAQDQDYLNIICKDRVHDITLKWNTMLIQELDYPESEIKMIHYNMAVKPWNYDDCRFASYFWKYCEMTDFYEEILENKNNYSEESKLKDSESGNNLINLVIKELENEDNYLRLQNKDKGRRQIVKKIHQLEVERRFDEDIELDPPARQILPDEVDYLRKKLISKVKTKFAYQAARKYLNNIIKNKQMIVKDIIGIENLANLDSGAIITCNHFNAFDSFAIQLAYEASNQRKRKFFRVIKEGNYTSFPGFYGMLMRNCNTLPLSSNPKTMNVFMKSVDQLLKDGHFVLVYPEQSMWWNYKKPKPLKKGAYLFAAKANVPVVPCFITMEDSDIIGEDGYYIQEYTIHIEKPIYPNEDKKISENVNNLLNSNYDVWKEIYEKVYNIPLVYET